jgi:hypothetical protein
MKRGFGVEGLMGEVETADVARKNEGRKRWTNPMDFLLVDFKPCYSIYMPVKICLHIPEVFSP